MPFQFEYVPALLGLSIAVMYLIGMLAEGKGDGGGDSEADRDRHFLIFVVVSLIIIFICTIVYTALHP